VSKSGLVQKENKRFNFINILIGIILRSIFMLGAILVLICVVTPIIVDKAGNDA
jgi:hypothetical protein